jgi:hypothetical protein
MAYLHGGEVHLKRTVHFTTILAPFFVALFSDARSKIFAFAGFIRSFLSIRAAYFLR